MGWYPTVTMLKVPVILSYHYHITLQKGKTPKAKQQKEDKKAKAVEVSESVESTTDASVGIIVQCIKEGGKVRVRPLSGGYNSKDAAY